MGLESGTTIADFRPEWPEGSDPKYEGDNHLKLIKSILQTQFPGKDLGGLNIPILSNEQELNWSQGLRNNIQTQIDNIDSAGSSLAGQVAALQQQVDAMIPLKVVGAFNGITLGIIAGSGWSVRRATGFPEGAFEVYFDTPANGNYVVTESAGAYSAVDVVNSTHFLIVTTDKDAIAVNPEEVHFMVSDA